MGTWAEEYDGGADGLSGIDSGDEITISGDDYEATSSGITSTDDSDSSSTSTTSSTTPTGSDNPFNWSTDTGDDSVESPDRIDEDEEDDIMEDLDSDPVSDTSDTDTTTPTGSNNPFNWDTDTGDSTVDPPDRIGDREDGLEFIDTLAEEGTRAAITEHSGEGEPLNFSLPEVPDVGGLGGRAIALVVAAVVVVIGLASGGTE